MNSDAEETVEIYVNEDKHPVDKEKISYDEIVAIFLKDGGVQSADYLVKYSRGHSKNVKGTLEPGQEVMVQDEMRFRVSGTGES